MYREQGQKNTLCTVPPWENDIGLTFTTLFFLFKAPLLLGGRKIPTIHTTVTAHDFLYCQVKNHLEFKDVLIISKSAQESARLCS